MRAIPVLVVLCAVAAPVSADSRTRELAQGYDKELAACRTRADGVTRVATGAQALVDEGQKQYEADLAALRAAWYIAYAKPTRRLRVACRVTKAGAIVATLDEPAAASAWPELEPVLVAMIAARP